MLTSNKLKQLTSIVFFVANVAIAIAEVPRPIGVSLVKATLYQPRPDGTWQCLDGSKTIKFMQLNDDYCDCADFSDEPGTSACSQGFFHCVNRGHRAQVLPSSRVNDGICDCCDGSDEYEDAQCSNTCDELGRFEREQRKSLAEMLKKGSVKRSEMVSRSRTLKADREKRRQELEQQRQEQEALKSEKEEFKKIAEAAEKEALDHFKEQHSEKEKIGATNEFDDSLFAEASAYFRKYDTNNNGLLEVTELQLDMSLDQDRNGEVTIVEAKYFMDDQDHINLDSFIALSWPRIKPMQMIVQGIFKPPTSEDETGEIVRNPELDDMIKEYNVERGVETPNQEEESIMHPYPAEPEDDEEAFDDEEADVGEGTVENVNTENPIPPPEYDPETLRLMELANEARNTVSSIESTIREIEQEIKDIDEQSSRDYGPNDVYATLEGECHKFEDREYVYTLCPFERASQQPRSGGSETTLGRWDQWLHEGDQKYLKQKYAHGASCWNGPQRSTIVQLKCSLESRITSVSEPNRCEYFMEFETPAACDEEAFHAEEQRLRDEL